MLQQCKRYGGVAGSGSMADALNTALTLSDDSLVVDVALRCVSDVSPDIDPGRILACVCCLGSLSKATTFECGHTLCASCKSSIGKCPLPGRTCRDMPSHVIAMTESGRLLLRACGDFLHGTSPWWLAPQVFGFSGPVGSLAQ